MRDKIKEYLGSEESSFRLLHEFMEISRGMADYYPTITHLFNEVISKINPNAPGIKTCYWFSNRELAKKIVFLIDKVKNHGGDEYNLIKDEFIEILMQYYDKNIKEKKYE